MAADQVSQLMDANLCRQQDLASAAAYLRLAHYNGEEVASCDYAMFLIKGMGIPRDVEQGIRIYQQSARFSRTGASHAALGSLYHTDTAMRDEYAATDYFRQAPALRHFAGSAYWGLYLWKGCGGVPADHQEARRLFTELAARKPKMASRCTSLSSCGSGRCAAPEKEEWWTSSGHSPASKRPLKCGPSRR
jgi:TPR repeat protein